MSVIKVEPGPFPLDTASFDVVFSEDLIIQRPDNFGLAREAYRVLRLMANSQFPTGLFLTMVRRLRR